MTTPPTPSRPRKPAEAKAPAPAKAAPTSAATSIAPAASAAKHEAAAVAPAVAPAAAKVAAAPAKPTTAPAVATDKAPAPKLAAPKPAAPKAVKSVVPSAPAADQTALKPFAAVPTLPPAVAHNYEQAVAFTKDQVEKAHHTALKTYEDITALNKETVDALVQSSSVVAKGVENLSRAFLAFAQHSLESGVSTAKALLAVKTLREAVDLQSEFARSSFDNLVAEATKASELTIKVTNDAITPLSSHVNTVVAKLGKNRAAA